MLTVNEARGFIFDFDGTLYDSHRLAVRLVFNRLPEWAILLSERRTRHSLAGCDYGEAEAYYREFFSRLSRRTHKPESFLRSWYFDSYLPRMCRILKKHYRRRPEVPGLFNELTRSSLKFAVYSDYSQVTERLGALDLADCSGSLLYSAENFGAQKPAARPFLSIAEAMGIPPEKVLVVGDRDDTDGAGAAAAGMGYIRIITRKKQKNHGYPSLTWEEFCTACSAACKAAGRAVEDAAALRA